ncbi:F-box domain protein [Colletotrichum sojae]|uniref:F-box domain protein n=1 Tax=Colletotrichum sojae TaxID=2175907 RepID=A0A8H6MMI4_9PEZI|nr:F-box domain protein [Colletotrichum sojae]
MVSLLTLPTEIQDAILSEIPSQQLCSLSRTCHLLYKALLPLVYHDIIIRITRHKGVPTGITCLLRTILERPAYANYITRLSFDENCEIQGPCCTPLLLRGLKDDANRALVQRAVEELRLPNPHEWISAIFECDNVSAVSSLLLARCAHLQSFSLNPSATYTYYTSPWFEWVLEYTLSAPRDREELSSFNSLSHLTIHGGKLSVKAFLLLFYLPRVATLDLACTGYYDRYTKGDGSLIWPTYIVPQWPLANPPNATNLTSLRLRETKTTVRTIEFVLRQTPNLKSLFYHRISSYLELSELRKALDHVRVSLSYLEVRYGMIDEPDPENLATLFAGRLGSLASFAALEELNISFAVLYGHDRPPPWGSSLAELLPSGLRRLTMNCDLEGYHTFEDWNFGEVGGETTVLEAYARNGWKTATPHLEELTVDWKDAYSSTTRRSSPPHVSQYP